MQTSTIHKVTVTPLAQPVETTEGAENSNLSEEFSKTLDRIAITISSPSGTLESPGARGQMQKQAKVKVKSDLISPRHKASTEIKEKEAPQAPVKTREKKLDNSEEPTDERVEDDKNEVSTKDSKAAENAVTVAKKDGDAVQGQLEELSDNLNAGSVSEDVPSSEDGALHQSKQSTALESVKDDRSSAQDGSDTTSVQEASEGNTLSSESVEGGTDLIQQALEQAFAGAEISTDSASIKTQGGGRLEQLSNEQLLSRALEKIIELRFANQGVNLAEATSEGSTMTFRGVDKGQAISSTLMNGIKGLMNSSSSGTVDPAYQLQFNDPSGSKGADSSHRNESAKGGQTLTRPQIARTIEKVETAIKEAKDGKTISVRLDPPELGTVKVDVSYKEGGLHARIVAEQGSVVHLLKERTSELVMMIRKLGLAVEKVTVAVSGQSEQYQGGHSNFDLSSHHGGGQGGQAKQERRFGVDQNFGNQRMRQMVVDDHWIA